MIGFKKTNYITMYAQCFWTICCQTYLKIKNIMQIKFVCFISDRLSAALVLPVVLCVMAMTEAEAACEKYSRFNPYSGRTTSEAWEADQFVKSVGVNLHLGAGRYDSEFSSKVKPRLLELGIKSVRTNAYSLTTRPNHVIDLGRAGIRFTIATDPQTNIAKLISGIKSVGPQYILAVEGFNEPENYANRYGCNEREGCWVRPTRDFQKALFNAIQADPATRSIPVLGPSLKTQNLTWSPQLFGNIDAYIDGHNMHRYAGRNNHPEIAKYPDFLGELANVIRYGGNASKPAFLTETGYSTATSTEIADAVYMPRMYLHNFDHGISFTSKYQLLDETGKSDFENSFGYIRTNNTPKKSFNNVKNLLALLSDPGPRFSPSSLNYVISGNVADVYTVLLQKRNGVFYLALWVAKKIDSISPQAVTVALPSSIKGAAFAVSNNSQTWFPISISNSRITMSVDGNVKILRLTGQEMSRPLC